MDLLISYLAVQLGRFKKEDTGASAVEYGLLVGLIAVAIIVAVSLLGDQLASMFKSVTDGLSGGGTTG
jgi:pilus assembly protein Flp/PilA